MPYLFNLDLFLRQKNVFLFTWNTISFAADGAMKNASYLARSYIQEYQYIFLKCQKMTVYMKTILGIQRLHLYIYFRLSCIINIIVYIDHFSAPPLILYI